jgi:hypothetical protein
VQQLQLDKILAERIGMQAAAEEDIQAIKDLQMLVLLEAQEEVALVLAIMVLEPLLLQTQVAVAEVADILILQMLTVLVVTVVQVLVLFVIKAQHKKQLVEL